ncbi:MAG TPA: O-antigen ligase family protein [Candidatus Saccharimonadia bacterium]
MKAVEGVAVRPIILGMWVACLAVAMAPWLTGGREPLAWVLSGFALLLGALLAWRQAAVAVLPRGVVVWSYAGLMLWALASGLWSANRYSTAVWVVMWGLAGLAFRLSYVVSASEAGRRWLLRAYLGLAVVFAVVGIGMYLFGDYERLVGSIYWPNPAAAYMMPAVLVALAGWLRAERRWDLARWGAVLGLCGAAFYLTGSRAAMLVLGLVTAIFLVVSNHVKHFWIKILFSVVIVTALSTGLVWSGNRLGHHHAGGTFGSRVGELASGKAQSGRDRLRYVESAVAIWLAQPILGSGAGTYGDVHPQYQQTVVSASTDVHNLYVQTLAELGLPGLVCQLALVVGLLWGMVQGLSWRPELVPVGCGVVGLLWHFGLDIDARYPALLCLLAVLAGMVVVPRRAGAVRPAGWRWPALAAGLLVPVVLLYQSEVAAERGRAAQRDEDYAAAANWFDQAGANGLANPDWVSAAGLNELAVAVQAAGQPDAQAAAYQLALDDARRAQQADPHDAQHWQLLGRVLVQRGKPGDLPAAERALRRALQLDGLNHPEYALDLARLQVAQRQPEAARATAERMLGLYPPAVVSNRYADPQLLHHLAELAALVGNLDLQAGAVPAAERQAQAALNWEKPNLAGRALMHQVQQLKAADSQ